VVVLGGALFVLLAYSLSTELFSRNSPTVLLNEAIDLIEDSEIVSSISVIGFCITSYH
jgi:import inner membrane translocase subunit TIM21